MAKNCSQSSNTISKPIERVFEDAQHTGKIQLKCRKLRDYPKLAAKYDLVDTISADLSKNRFTEVPMEVCSYLSMEKLNCYHNVIKSIPESINLLQALTYLNLSRNQLSNIPIVISQLQTLEVLIASHNRLVSLPEELGVLDKLMELDVSCNQISHLPSQIGNLKSLKSLDVRRNLLQELPVDISKLNLRKLDASCNKISQIPTVFRKIETLEEIILDHNPLTLPPAYVCTKGKQHIMKYLQIVAIREDKVRLGMLGDVELKKFRKSMPSAPSVSSEDFCNYLDSQDKWKRHTVMSNDSGYSTTDSVEKCCWSPQETATDTQHQADINNPATRSATAQYRSSRYPLPSELSRLEPPELPWQRSSSRLSSDDSNATLTPTTPSVPLQSVVFRPMPFHPPTLFPSSLQTPLSPPAPHGPGPGMHGTTQNSPSLEDEFTRELQRQKQEYENKKKVAEQLRIQHEEDEREQHRRIAQRMQDEQCALLDRQKKEAEEVKRLEIDKIRADGNCRLAGEALRKSEESKRTEDARRLQEAKYPRTEQSFYLPANSPTLNNAWPSPPLGTVSQHAVCSPSAIHGSAPAVPGLVPVVPGSPFNQTSPYRTSNISDVNSNHPANDESNLPSYGQTFKLIEDRNSNSHGEISHNVQEQAHGLYYPEHSVNQQKQYNSVHTYHGQNIDIYSQQVGQFPQHASQGLNQYEHSSVFGGNQYGQQQNHCKYQDLNQVTSPTYQRSISESARPNYLGQPNIICAGAPMPNGTRPPPTSQRNNHSTTGHLFMHNDNLSQMVAQAPLQHHSHLSTITSHDPANYGHHGNQFGHQDFQVQGQHDHHSSMPLDSLSENRKSNLSSSGSFKEEHRSSESQQQYRRSASDSNQRLSKSDLPVSDHQTHGIRIINGPIEEQSILNGNPPVTSFTNFNHNLSNNHHLSNSAHNSHTAITTIPSDGDIRPIAPQGLPGTQRPKGAAPDPTRPTRIVDNKAKRPMQSAPPAVTGVLPTSKIGIIQQDDELKRAQHPLMSTSTLDGPKGIGDQRLRSVQNDTVQRRSTGSTSSEDDKKRPPPTRSTGLHNSVTAVSKRAGTVMTSAHVKMLDDYSKVASNVNSSVQKHHEMQIENKHMEQLRQIISTRLKRSLPDNNLLEALCDGVLLCHLANQIRPRSVASVHVPSPAVPKLSLPKCKKNVENFLDACRKIGVPKDQICDATDILTEHSLHHVATTVFALVATATKNHTEVSAV